MEMTHEYNWFYGGSLGFNQQQMVNYMVYDRYIYTYLEW